MDRHCSEFWCQSGSGTRSGSALKWKVRPGSGLASKRCLSTTLIFWVLTKPKQKQNLNFALFGTLVYGSRSHACQYPGPVTDSTIYIMIWVVSRCTYSGRDPFIYSTLVKLQFAYVFLVSNLEFFLGNLTWQRPGNSSPNSARVCRLSRRFPSTRNKQEPEWNMEYKRRSTTLWSVSD